MRLQARSRERMASSRQRGKVCLLVLRKRALGLMSRLERRNEDAIICYKKGTGSRKCIWGKIVLSSDEALVARSYPDASFPVIIGLNARANVTSVMNGEPHSTTSLLIILICTSSSWPA